jgi:outer membrane protein assembly factor BamB
VLADGKIYITSEDGLTTVLAAGPKFEVLSENPLNDYTLSSPAISDGRIYIRTGGFLYSIGTK